MTYFTQRLNLILILIGTIFTLIIVIKKDTLFHRYLEMYKNKCLKSR